MFGGMGLGDTPNSANVSRNVFGGSAFGGASPSSSGKRNKDFRFFYRRVFLILFRLAGQSGVFGSSAFGNVSAGTPSFGSPAPGAFGGAPAFGQVQSPTFGGGAAPAFGGAPLFGSKPAFGSPLGAAALSPPKAPESTGGFGAFAAANSGPSFAALASNTQQPAFGGAAFPQSSSTPFPGYVTSRILFSRCHYVTHCFLLIIFRGSSFSSWR